MTGAVLGNALLPDGRRVDVAIDAGRISAIEPPGAIAAPTIELAGALLVAGFVDGHVHLDKTLLGHPFVPHRPGSSVAERIARERALRRELAYRVETRARHLIAKVVAHGTTALRTHVDVDSEIGLEGLHALLAVREQVRDLIDIQIVAFPQSGVISDPGTADLLDQAVGEGADLVGGLDPAGIDNDVEGQLDIIFDMLERAMLIGYRQGFLADADLKLAFDLANGAAARVLGLADHGLGVGAAADLVAIDAGSIPEAVAAHPPPHPGPQARARRSP